MTLTPLARRVIATRVAEEQFRAAPGDSRATRLEALPGEFSSGVQPDRESDSEGAGGREREAGLGGHRSSGRLRSGDAEGSDRR